MDIFRQEPFAKLVERVVVFIAVCCIDREIAGSTTDPVTVQISRCLYFFNQTKKKHTKTVQWSRPVSAKTEKKH